MPRSGGRTSLLRRWTTVPAPRKVDTGRAPAIRSVQTALTRRGGRSRPRPGGHRIGQGRPVRSGGRDQSPAAEKSGVAARSPPRQVYCHRGPASPPAEKFATGGRPAPPDPATNPGNAPVIGQVERRSTGVERSRTGERGCPASPESVDNPWTTLCTGLWVALGRAGDDLAHIWGWRCGQLGLPVDGSSLWVTHPPDPPSCPRIHPRVTHRWPCPLTCVDHGHPHNPQGLLLVLFFFSSRGRKRLKTGDGKSWGQVAAAARDASAVAGAPRMTGGRITLYGWGSQRGQLDGSVIARQVPPTVRAWKGHP